MGRYLSIIFRKYPSRSEKARFYALFYVRLSFAYLLNPCRSAPAGSFLYVRQEEDVARHELDAFFQVVQAEQFQIENGQTFVFRAELMGDVP